MIRNLLFVHCEVGRGLPEAKRSVGIHHFCLFRHNLRTQTTISNAKVSLAKFINYMPIHKFGSPTWLLTVRHALLFLQDQGLFLVLCH